MHTDLAKKTFIYLKLLYILLTFILKDLTAFKVET